MQLRTWLAPAAFALAGWCAAGVPRCAADPLAEEPGAGTLLRLFTDSEKVSVRSLMGDYDFSPRSDVGVALHWNNERVTIPAVQAPVGSAEAIDAITTASRPIAGNAFQDFIKVRNEFQGAVNRGGTAVEYYISSETDYLAQQLGARYSREFMNDQLTLSFGTSYAWDAIRPLADDDTDTGAGSKTTLHWNAVATQVLTPTTMVRVGLEYNIVEGLQHNPYRNVYAGGGNVAERHPDHRERRDAFLRLNQYLKNRSSLRLSYRLYDDDWGVMSHEIGSRLSQYITQGFSARYSYRYYTQTPADFYRDEYLLATGVDGYRTGDYRLGDLSSHLFGVALNLDLDSFAEAHPFVGRLGVWFNYDRYFNSNNYSANILETGIGLRF